MTSPPYWGLRDYGTDGQLGLEPTPDEYVATMVRVFSEVRRVLRDDGTLWLNLGDSYAADRGGTYMPAETLAGGVSGQGGEATMRGRGDKVDGNARRDCKRYGLKHKDLVGIPWRVAFALQADGWYLRSEIIWAKRNCMPESVTDRPTKSHETLFLLSKAAAYYYDADAISEQSIHAGRLVRYDGSQKNCSAGDSVNDRATLIASDRTVTPTRNRRTVWTIATQPFTGAKLLTDYVGVDGKPYRASPDCPIHGHMARERSARTDGCGEQPSRPVLRSPGSGACPAQEHSGEPASIASNSSCTPDSERSDGRTPESIDGRRTQDRSRCSACGQDVGGETGDHTCCTPGQRALRADSSGSTCPSSSQPATPSSSRSHRTDPGPATTEPCTASAQTHGRTGDTSESPALFELRPDTHGSSIAAGSAAGERATCPSAQRPSHSVRRPSSCNCTIVSDAHFATYPEKLVEPCVLAGCPVGGTVLDPFTGSGTTGAVACRLGRNFVGVELNPEYAAMAERRIAPHRDQLQLAVTP